MYHDQYYLGCITITNIEEPSRNIGDQTSRSSVWDRSRLSDHQDLTSVVENSVISKFRHWSWMVQWSSSSVSYSAWTVVDGIRKEFWLDQRSVGFVLALGRFSDLINSSKILSKSVFSIFVQNFSRSNDLWDPSKNLVGCFTSKLCQRPWWHQWYRSKPAFCLDQ